MIDKDALKIKELEHVLIEKAGQLFRDMLYAPEPNGDEYPDNDLKQTLKNKPRAKTRDGLAAATSPILKSIQGRPDRVKSYFPAKPVR